MPKPTSVNHVGNGHLMEFQIPLFASILQIGSFRWKFHDTNSQIPNAPFKIMVRDAAVANPELRRLLSHILNSAIVKKGFYGCFDALADIPLAMTPVITTLSDRSSTPMVILDYKNKRILGAPKPKTKIIIVDDVLSFGDSKLEAIKLAQEYDLEVVGILVLVDYGIGTAQLIELNFNIKVASAFTIEEFLETCRDVIPEDESKMILSWLTKNLRNNPKLLPESIKPQHY